ncbi:unnamed protein product [Ectocarpus fasciculatus]
MMRPPLARRAAAGYVLSCGRRRRAPPSPSSFTGQTPTRGWSSSGFAAPGGDAGAAEMPGLPSAFPWRDAPDNRGVRGLAERAMHSVMQHQHRRFLRAATKLDDADDDAFLRAAEMAFVQVAAGVFQMPAHQVIAPLANGGGGEGKASSASGDRGIRRDGLPVWDIPEGAVVDPRDVMHKDLAEFYLQAAVAAKVSRSTPFYRLHGFSSCEISNVNVLWGAQRGDLPEEGETIEIWGSKYALKSLLQDIKAISSYRLSKDRAVLDKPLSSIRKTTVQVDVDIGCTETFFVSDDRTEEVVQGSKAVAVRKHRLRLESSPFLKRDFQWSVVDLDNWMKGNTFW